MVLLKFADNLKDALYEKEMTQQELAALVGTTQATINRWLKGVNEPNLETLLRICLCLNVTPNFILGYDEIPDDFLKKLN